MAIDIISPPVSLRGYFNEADVGRIVEMGESEPMGNAFMLHEGMTKSSSLRQHRFSLVYPKPSNKWLFEELGLIVEKINRENFGFKLEGIGEPCQFNVYSGCRADHIDWHTDRGFRYPDTCRKLTAAIQLSNEMDYCGGTLEIRDPTGIVSVEKMIGTISIFPSFLEHRITQVEVGTRKSLTVFYTGPSFQ